MTIFRRLFGSNPAIPAARSLYGAIVAQARREGFYSRHAVPDTLDGRFDMIALHAILVMDRLGAAGAKDFAQLLFDEMFTALDHNLREMGVGDLSVPKRVKKMAEVFYGRAGAYRAALKDGAATHELADALKRNVYPDGLAPEQAGVPDALAAYVRSAVTLLAGQKDAELKAGHVTFP